MQNINEVWTATLEIIEEKISKPSFETWLETSKPEAIVDDVLTIIVESDFARDWLEDRYAKLISTIIEDISGMKLTVKFALPKHDEPKVIPEKETKDTKQTPTQKKLGNLLNPKYTFDSFVIGSGNRFAHAASLAAAEAPAKAYNPLFIYGGVGLGKTHLMHAIGHHVSEHNRNANIVYISSEKFTNEFINAIGNNKTREFRNKYRNIDILLIDDIQFIAGKESTQEEFFHTFNTLHEENKQIIISSDRSPKEISTLEERLRSRFEWGLITDITPPDLETRIAILNKKAKSEGLEIPNDVMVYIANQIDTNIRELEGALTRIIAYSTLINEDINTELAKEALKDIISGKQSQAITIKKIQDIVGQNYDVKLEELLSKRRTKTITFPRQIAMYLSRELTDNSLPKIGKEFGGRDHSTVIHAHEKIQKQIDSDPQFHKEINILKEKLNN